MASINRGFTPDKIFDDVFSITPEVMDKDGVKGLILDIDNTLAPRYVPLPDAKLKNWTDRLSDSGNTLFVVSNSRGDRAKRFAEALELPFIGSGMKPMPLSFYRAAKYMKVPKGKIAAVGDQIYTDVAGAHIYGIKGWLVKPIDPRENLIFRMRRRLEKPFIKKYYSVIGGGDDAG